MKIEITNDQFNLIQDEIIRLEEEIIKLPDNDPWGFIFLKEQIDKLKEILKTEEIEL